MFDFLLLVTLRLTLSVSMQFYVAAFSSVCHQLLLISNVNAIKIFLLVWINCFAELFVLLLASLTSCPCKASVTVLIMLNNEFSSLVCFDSNRRDFCVCFTAIYLLS